MNQFLPLALQFALDTVAIVFLLGGVAKLTQLRAFREGLLALPYMRVSWSYAIGYSLPFIEIAVAAALYLNLFWGKLAAIGLLTSFCGMTALVLSRRLDVSCNCFGNLGERGFSPRTLVENLLLTGFAAASLALPARMDWWIGLCVAAFLLELYILALGLLENVREVRKLQDLGAL